MDTLYMEKALALARSGKGKTYTNPLVGVVIVKDGVILAAGYHQKYGDKHAEKMAMDQCDTPEELIDSTMYVTLEPCNHAGKQPPCTQTIIESGISKVVIAQLDPNPIVAGKGKAYLESHGIQVVVGLLEEKARGLNKYYNYFYEKQQPYVVLKQAISLDGKIAVDSGRRTFITGTATYKKVRDERQHFQAVLVGSRTVMADNPELLPNIITDFPPIRIILDRRGETLDFKKYQIYRKKAPVWVFTGMHKQGHVPAHIRLIQDNHWTIPKVVEVLKKEGIQSVYVEGGSRMHDAFLEENIFEEVITYIAPKLIGGSGVPAFSSNRSILSAVTLALESVEKIGEDVRIVSRRAEEQCLRD